MNTCSSANFPTTYACPINFIHKEQAQLTGVGLQNFPTYFQLPMKCLFFCWHLTIPKVLTILFAELKLPSLSLSLTAKRQPFSLELEHAAAKGTKMSCACHYPYQHKAKKGVLKIFPLGWYKQTHKKKKKKPYSQVSKPSKTMLGCLGSVRSYPSLAPAPYIPRRCTG